MRGIASPHRADIVTKDAAMFGGVTYTDDAARIAFPTTPSPTELVPFTPGKFCSSEFPEIRGMFCSCLTARQGQFDT
jgi:hypothetical protein